MRPDVVNGRHAALGDEADRHVAGGDDRIESVRRHAEADHLLADRRARPWGVADEHHRAAALAESDQRIGSGAKGFFAVMQHAPDVAQNDIVAIGDGAEPVDDGHARFRGSCDHARGG